MKSYTFYKDEQEYQTDNLVAFCREHGLQRRHLQEVVIGKRHQHHGFTIAAINSSIEEGGMTVEQVLQMAEIAARSSGDPEYEALVMSRTAKVRQGQALRIKQGDDGSVTMLD